MRAPISEPGTGSAAVHRLPAAGERPRLPQRTLRRLEPAAERAPRLGRGRR